MVMPTNTAHQVKVVRVIECFVGTIISLGVSTYIVIITKSFICKAHVH